LVALLFFRSKFSDQERCATYGVLSGRPSPKSRALPPPPTPIPEVETTFTSPHASVAPPSFEGTVYKSNIVEWPGCPRHTRCGLRVVLFVFAQ
jgi:hypothetical protein